MTLPTGASRLLLLSVLAAAPPGLSASGTRFWELTTREALAEGEAFENVVLTSEGELRLGAAAEAMAVEGERQVWSLLRMQDGDLLAGTAGGRILRLAGGKVEVEFASEEMLVTALVAGGEGRIYAATLPNGKVFRRDAAGAWSLFATLPCKYVWSLLPDARRHLVAATGPDGKLFAIDAEGKAETLFETGKENVLSLAAGADGALYFGTANPGLLYRLGPDGRVAVLRDFGANEVRVIRARPAGLVVGVNSGVKASPANFLGAVQQAAQKAETKEGEPAPAAPADGGGPPGGAKGGPPAAPAPAKKPAAPAATVSGAVVFLAPAGRLERQVEYPQSYITDLAVTADGVAVATNNSGRIHRLDDGDRSTLLWDFPQNQVLVLAVDAGRLALAGTGDAAVVQRLGDKPAAAGHYLSKIYDARQIADWGSLTWRGTGRITFASRSGNVAEPDATWSAWAQAEAAPGGALPPGGARSLRVASPAGRFLQLRLSWDGDPLAVVSGVTVACLPENQVPRVLEVKIQPAPVPGQPAPAAGAPAQNQPALVPLLHSTFLKVTWRAEDPDGDPLVFRLLYRAENGTAWVPLLDRPVGGAEFLWNTESVPDGRYVLRVEASDEAANEASRALRADRACPPFCVDHGKPEITLAVAWDGRACRVTGSAADALSPIAALAYSIDGGEWRSLFPADRIFDARTEAFEFVEEALAPGPHVITVRALDGESNVGSAAVAVAAP